MLNIPTVDYGGQGDLIYFAHANAYPPGAYKQLLQNLSQKFRVKAIVQKPLRENEELNSFKSWEELADDIIASVEEQNQQVIGMGHSLGAVALILAATKRPELFSKLVLMDPVLFPKLVKYILPLMPIQLRKYFIPISRKALKRKSSWYTKEEMFKSYRRKEVFKRFSDEALWDYVESGTVQDAKTKMQNLRYTKEWESRIYSTVHYVIDKLFALEIPIFAVRGDETNVIKRKVWESWKKEQQHNHFLNVAFASHLVPMEYPEVISKWLIEYL